MEQTQNNNGAGIEKTRGIILSEGKLLLAVFLGGTSIVLWLYSFVLKPQNSQNTDIQLLQNNLEGLQDTVYNLRDNHIHTLEVKIDTITEEQKKQALQMEKIQTILEERLPAKK